MTTKIHHYLYFISKKNKQLKKLSSPPTSFRFEKVKNAAPHIYQTTLTNHQKNWLHREIAAEMEMGARQQSFWVGSERWSGVKRMNHYPLWLKIIGE